MARASWRRGAPALKPLDPVDTGRDDPALIAFTSGTTGVPKGCIQFHRDILAPCDTFATAHFRMKPGDVVMTSAPIAFTFGLGATLMFPLRFGAATRDDRAALAAGDARGNREAWRHPPRHRADRLQGDAVAARARRRVEDPEMLPVGGRAFAQGELGGVEGAHRHCDRRRHRLDRDDAHLHLRKRRRYPPRLHRPRGAGL